MCWSDADRPWQSVRQGGDSFHRHFRPPEPGGEPLRPVALPCARFLARPGVPSLLWKVHNWTGGPTHVCMPRQSRFARCAGSFPQEEFGVRNRRADSTFFRSPARMVAPSIRRWCDWRRIQAFPHWCGPGSLGALRQGRKRNFSACRFHGGWLLAPSGGRPKRTLFAHTIRAARPAIFWSASGPWHLARGPQAPASSTTSSPLAKRPYWVAGRSRSYKSCRLCGLQQDKGVVSA